MIPIAGPWRRRRSRLRRALELAVVWGCLGITGLSALALLLALARALR